MTGRARRHGEKIDAETLRKGGHGNAGAQVGEIRRRGTCIDSNFKIGSD